MKVGKIKSLLIAIFGCFYAVFAYSATSLFSDYGQIQNVQNYSTNPFWTPNSPYNQKMPQPVYVQGTAISNEECVKVLQSAVSMQCMARDNCKNTSLSDIRPAVIVQLSNLPNKAYSTACIGYLDTVYESYVAQYGNNAPTGRVNFPNATTPNPSLNNNAPVIQNPYEIKTPKWQQEINERSQELQRLQSQTNSVNTGLTATAFPTTYADLSFSERMANDAEGYAPYKGTTAYKTINVTYNTAEWCSNHAGAPECKEYEEEKRKAEQAKRAANTTNTSAGNKQNTKDNFTSKEQRLAASEIVKLLQPENEAQKEFFTALAAEYTAEKSKNSSLMLNGQFIFDFFSSDANRINTFKNGLQNLANKQPVKTGDIDINWIETMEIVSTVLDDSKKRYGAMVCENNRSYQAGIDAVLWGTTVVSAVATFWAGGAGGAASAAAVTGVKATVKAAVKGAIKAGIKYAALAAAGAIIIKTKGTYAANDVSPSDFAKSSAGFIYSLVDSEPRTDIINCQGLDLNEKCYSPCNQAGDKTQDELNKQVLYPVMGKNYCVGAADYTLYEINTRTPLMMTPEQYNAVKNNLPKIQDKGGCDWNEDDIDMFIGSYLYDPNTFEPSTHLLIEEVIRLDN